MSNKFQTWIDTECMNFQRYFDNKCKRLFQRFVKGSGKIVIIRLMQGWVTYWTPNHQLEFDTVTESNNDQINDDSNDNEDISNV